MLSLYPICYPRQYILPVTTGRTPGFARETPFMYSEFIMYTEGILGGPFGKLLYIQLKFMSEKSELAETV